MMEEKLPDGWMLAKIGDVADVIESGFPYGRYNIEGIGFPHLRPMNIDKQGNLSLNEIKYVNLVNPPLLHNSDILFNNTNSPAWVGKTTIITRGEQYTFSNHMTRLTLNLHAGNAHFFALQLQYMQQSGYFLERCVHHVNQASIASSYLTDNVDVAVAPLPEQSRIVAAIEQQFTRLDNAVASLHSAKARIKQYRASLLKSAVEGTLTKAWRAEHPAEETGEQLLKRILVERRKHWEEEQLAKMREKPKDDKWKLKYEEPQKPDVEKLPELPEGWCWATVEQVGDVIGGVTKGRDLAKRITATLPYLRVANVQQGFLDLDVMKTIEIPEDEVEKYLLRSGDVLLTEGGDADKLGRAAIWKGEIEKCIHQNHIFRARLVEANIPPLWLVFYANSELGRSFFLNAAKQTVNLASINLTQLRNCPIPLPPLAEQAQIVAEVEANLSNIAKLEEATENNLKRAKNERQSILQEAFAGRLVAQDAEDEPASVLLERIRGEREARVKSEEVRRRDNRVNMEQQRKKRKKVAPLYDVLVEAGGELPPEELYKQSQMQRKEQQEQERDEGFYVELDTEVTATLIVEERPAPYEVLLRAVEQDEEDMEEGEETETSDTIPGGKMRKVREKISRPSLWDE